MSSDPVYGRIMSMLKLRHIQQFRRRAAVEDPFITHVQPASFDVRRRLFKKMALLPKYTTVQVVSTVPLTTLTTHRYPNPTTRTHTQLPVETKRSTKRSTPKGPGNSVTGARAPLDVHRAAREALAAAGKGVVCTDDDNNNDDDGDADTDTDADDGGSSSPPSKRKGRGVRLPKCFRTSSHLADLAEPDGSVVLAFASPDDDMMQLNNLLARHIAMKVAVPLTPLRLCHRTAFQTLAQN